MVEAFEIQAQFSIRTESGQNPADMGINRKDLPVE